jgi:hypothetical protein
MDTFFFLSHTITWANISTRQIRSIHFCTLPLSDKKKHIKQNKIKSRPPQLLIYVASEKARILSLLDPYFFRLITRKILFCMFSSESFGAIGSFGAKGKKKMLVEENMLLMHPRHATPLLLCKPFLFTCSAF